MTHTIFSITYFFHIILNAQTKQPPSQFGHFECSLNSLILYGQAITSPSGSLLPTAMHWRTKHKIILNSQKYTISIFGKYLSRHSLSWVLKYPTILSLAGIFLFTLVIRPALLTTKINPWKYTLRTITHLPVTNLHFHSKLLPSCYPTSPQFGQFS